MHRRAHLIVVSIGTADGYRGDRPVVVDVTVHRNAPERFSGCAARCHGARHDLGRVEVRRVDVVHVGPRLAERTIVAVELVDDR